MAFLIGTDEAGYGPNLGPLVISATVWEVPDEVGGEGLFDRLSHVITQDLRPVDGHRSPRVVIADSKKVYTSGKGLRHLERGLWPTLKLLDCSPRTWRDVWHALAPGALDAMLDIPWYADHDCPAPSACDAVELEPLTEVLRSGLATAGVRLIAMQSRAIFAHHFNDLVEQYGSKGAALSQQTLELASAMIEPLPTAPISVICDKHGGRDRYGPLLAEHFPEWLIEVRAEGRKQSLYRFGPPDRRVDVCFRVKAESCLPAALASMASKYLRELAMQAFNDFWLSRVPGLQPTAGYPLDAKRFRVDIAEAQRKCRISDHILWRNR
jgi:hypothetical protein